MQLRNYLEKSHLSKYHKNDICMFNVFLNLYCIPNHKPYVNVIYEAIRNAI